MIELSPFFSQVSSKACGHTKGRKVVSREEALLSIRAAVDARDEGDQDMVIVARTDARQAVSMDEAIWRVQAVSYLCLCLLPLFHERQCSKANTMGSAETMVIMARTDYLKCCVSRRSDFLALRGASVLLVYLVRTLVLPASLLFHTHPKEQRLEATVSFRPPMSSFEQQCFKSLVSALYFGLSNACL